MFLFARLVMENLFAQPTVEEIINQLHPDVFPEGLDAA